MSCGRCDSSTYDSSSVSCATPRERDAVVGQHVLVVLDVLADLGPGRVGEPRRERARACGRGRAGPARRCSGARAGCSRRGPARCRTTGRRSARPSGRGWSSRCRSRRGPPPRARAASARARPRRTPSRSGAAGASCGACARRILRREQPPGLARAPRRRSRRRGRPSARRPCRSRSQLLNSKRSNSAASAASLRRRRARGRRASTGSAQSVLTVSSAPALRQPVERGAQVLADDAADLAGVRDDRVERCRTGRATWRRSSGRPSTRRARCRRRRRSA